MSEAESAGSFDERRVRVSEREWNDSMAFSQAMRVGNQLWIAGQVPVASDGSPVGLGDSDHQAEQVWRNLKQVLEAAGGSLNDLVTTTTYITDRAHKEAAVGARRRYLRNSDWPANTLVIVDGLARPEYLIEISGVAVLR